MPYRYAYSVYMETLHTQAYCTLLGLRTVYETSYKS